MTWKSEYLLVSYRCSLKDKKCYLAQLPLAVKNLSETPKHFLVIEKTYRKIF